MSLNFKKKAIKNFGCLPESNKSNASLISCFCSSVNSGRGPVDFFFWPPLTGFLALALAVAVDLKV